MKLVFHLQPSATGYCNTMDAMPGSGRPSTRRKGKKKSDTLESTGRLTKTWGWGSTTLSSTRSNDSQENVGLSTLGGKSFVETYEFNAMTYIELVKKTFKKTPEVYKEFKQILGQIHKSSSKKVELIKRIITLFDGYHDLIRGFSNFLPPEITMEVQDHAVVLNVEDQEIGSDYEVKDDDDFGDDDTDIMRYMRNVKWTYMHQPGIYERFNRILQDYNRKNVNEMDTVGKIASLFEGQPDLVIGFNIFLPAEYKILEHERRGYVVRHPCKKGMRPHYTPVNVQEVYVS